MEVLGNSFDIQIETDGEYAALQISLFIFKKGFLSGN